MNDLDDQHPLQPQAREHLADSAAERRIQKLLAPLIRKGEQRDALLEKDAEFRRKVNAYEAVPREIKHLFARLWGEPLDLSTHRSVCDCMAQEYENWQVVLAGVWTQRERVDPALHAAIDKHRWRVAPKPARQAHPGASGTAIE